MKIEWLTDPETGRDVECYDGIPAHEYFKRQEMREATKEEQESVNNYIKSISQKVITIPVDEHTTNGDVIKALFPEIVTTDFYMTVHATTKMESNGVKSSISFDFWKDWWNAPYKKEGSK